MENLESLWNAASLSSIEGRKIICERSFENFEEFWDLTSSSTALQPVWKILDASEIADIKKFYEREFENQRWGKFDLVQLGECNQGYRVGLNISICASYGTRSTRTIDRGPRHLSTCLALMIE